MLDEHRNRQISLVRGARNATRRCLRHCSAVASTAQAPSSDRPISTQTLNSMIVPSHARCRFRIGATRCAEPEHGQWSGSPSEA